VDCTPCQDRDVTARRVKQGCAEVCLPITITPSPTHARAEVCKIALHMSGCRPTKVWGRPTEVWVVRETVPCFLYGHLETLQSTGRDGVVHDDAAAATRSRPHLDVAGRPAGSAALARRRWAQGLASCRERSSSPGNRGPQSWLMTLMHISCSVRRQPWTDTEPCHPLPEPPSWAAARGIRGVTWAKPRFDSPCHGITSWLLWSSLIDARTT
jgi:hypothetical protein